MNMTIQPFTGLQNPQQPIGGFLTNSFNPYPQASVSATPQSGLLSNMGPWSQLAYQMAGSPKQGGAWAPVAVPAAPPGGSGSGGSGGGSALGSVATGLLGAVLKNPSLIKGAYNGISGLLGGGAADGSAASILAGGSPALSTVGTGAVAPAVDSAAADAASALGGSAAGTAGGLLGSSAGATGANAIASGAAAAGQTGGAAAGGIGAGVAAPLAVAGLVGLIGSGVISDKANDAGNTAMSQWMKATGATFKPTYTNSGQNTFGTNNGLLSSKPGTWYDSSGKAMTPAQVAAAITAWGKANGINTGNINYAGP